MLASSSRTSLNSRSSSITQPLEWFRIAAVVAAFTTTHADYVVSAALVREDARDGWSLPGLHSVFPQYIGHFHHDATNATMHDACMLRVVEQIDQPLGIEIILSQLLLASTFFRSNQQLL